MLRLFQAGVIAALMQGVAILLATLLVFSYAHHRIESLQVPTVDPAVLSLVPLLQLIYLLTSAGVAAIRHRFVDLTAERIRRASRLMNPSDPERGGEYVDHFALVRRHGICCGKSRPAAIFSD
jgi:hypothetical protein